jgi:hypothetical protein
MVTNRVRAVPIPLLRLANGYPNILATLGYASGMSTTKEELRALVEQVPADKAERVLKLLKRTLAGPSGAKKRRTAGTRT